MDGLLVFDFDFLIGDFDLERAFFGDLDPARPLLSDLDLARFEAAFFFSTDLDGGLDLFWETALDSSSFWSVDDTADRLLI